DAALAEAASNAFITGDFRDVRRLLEKLRRDLGVDIADVLDPVTASSASSLEPPLAGTLVKSVGRCSSGVTFAGTDGDDFLNSYSPLRLFARMEAVLVLGYHLNGSIADEIEQSNRIKLIFDERMEASGERDEIRETDLTITGRDARKSTIA